MTKTNIGLVEYAEAQLGKPYWYGTFGNKATQSLLTSKANQYPAHYTSDRMSKYKSQIGQRVHDCVGLIKGYLWSDTPTSTPQYKASQDVSANGMIGKCKEWGNIDTMPEIVGLLVWMSGHIGVYVGNGYVIEAKGFQYGVVKTKLKGRGWKKWGKCPYITYLSASSSKPTGTAKPATSNKTYFKKYTGKSASFADALKEMGYNGSYSYRKKIATANGITAYMGLASQNTKLFKLFKAGTLIKP